MQANERVRLPAAVAHFQKSRSRDPRPGAGKSKSAAGILAALASLSLALAGVEAKETKAPIGSPAAKFSFKDIRFLPRTLDDFGKPNAFAIAFVTTECPLVRRYLPGLKELSAQYKDRGVQFIAVNVGADDSLVEVAYQALEYGVDFPFVKDFDGDCARALGATRTPEVVVLDAERKIRYRGRIDNQYRLGGVSCLAGDFMTEYAFDAPLKIGQKLVLEDMAHYTMVKTTTFNGVTHPDIAIWREGGRLEVVRRFGYKDYRNRLS